jgi:hypothetical protein
MDQYDIPILILLFNRPDTTQEVFNQVKKVQPKRLFLAADGARENVPGEKERCEEAKKIAGQIDWPCEVKTLFQTKNLGMLHGPATGIDWFFENVEGGIILEHDCVPSLSFFKFAEAMLAKYRDDERVMHISGNNFQQGRLVGEASYYFSKFNHVWGWASWRRAWKHFDTELKTFPEFKKNDVIRGVWPEKNKAKVFLKIFQNVYSGKLVAWDYVWTYSVWAQGGLSILPNVNLVSNIGFGPNATHTNKKDDLMAMATGEIGEITHPKFINSDYGADDFSFRKIYNSSLYKKIRYRLGQIIKKI